MNKATPFDTNAMKRCLDEALADAFLEPEEEEPKPADAAASQPSSTSTEGESKDTKEGDSVAASKDDDDSSSSKWQPIFGFALQEDHRVFDTKLLIMTLACLIAAAAQATSYLQLMPFQVARPYLAVGVISYFVLSGCYQLFIWFWEKDQIFRSKPSKRLAVLLDSPEATFDLDAGSGRRNGRSIGAQLKAKAGEGDDGKGSSSSSSFSPVSITIRTRLPRFDERYTVLIEENAASKTVAAVPLAEASESVGRFFTAVSLLVVLLGALLLALVSLSFSHLLICFAFPLSFFSCGGGAEGRLLRGPLQIVPPQQPAASTGGGEAQEAAAAGTDTGGERQEDAVNK